MDPKLLREEEVVPLSLLYSIGLTWEILNDYRIELRNEVPRTYTGIMVLHKESLMNGSYFPLKHHFLKDMKQDKKGLNLSKCCTATRPFSIFPHALEPMKTLLHKVLFTRTTQETTKRIEHDMNKWTK